MEATAQLTRSDRVAAHAKARSIDLRWGSLVFGLGVFVVYILIGLLAFRPLRPWSTGHLFGSPDAVASTWALGWVAHAIAHGHNPFLSGAILVPRGENLAQNTGALILGFICTPFTLAFGAVPVANFLMIFAMPISAGAAYVVLRRWDVWAPAAAFGGLVYGFCPFMIGQANSHLNLVFLPLPPFMVAVVVTLLQRKGRGWTQGIELGVLVVAQFLISPEILLSVAIFIAGTLVVLAIRYRHDVVSMVGYLVRPALIAVAIVVVLLAYPVYLEFAGPGHFSGPVQPIPNPYHLDFLSFVVPGPLQRLHLGMRNVGIYIMGGSNPSEAEGYIGIPLILIGAFLAWRSRRSGRMQVAFFALIGAAILSLGSRLTIHGHVTAVRLPFIVLQKLPLFDNVLATRLDFEMDACLAAILAFGIDDLWRQRNSWLLRSMSRAWTAGGTLALTLAVAVATWYPLWPYVAQPNTTLSAGIRAAIPGGNPVVLTYPYSISPITQPMLWQIGAKFDFQLVGGYVLNRGSNGRNEGIPPQMDPPQLQQFLAAQEGMPIYGAAPPINESLVGATKKLVAQTHIRVLLVDEAYLNAASVVKLYTQAFGPPKTVIDGFAVWSTNRNSL